MARSSNLGIYLLVSLIVVSHFHCPFCFQTLLYYLVLSAVYRLSVL